MIIKTATLLKFLNGKLSSSESNQVKQFLVDHPHYYDVLEGLSNMQKEEANERDLEQQLQQKKRNMRSKIFS